MLPSLSPPTRMPPPGFGQFVQPQGNTWNGGHVLPGIFPPQVPPPVKQLQAFGCSYPPVWQSPPQPWWPPAGYHHLQPPHGNGYQQNYHKRGQPYPTRQERKKPRHTEEGNMDGSFECINCSRSYEERIHYDNHMRSHKKCQHPGCNFEAIHKVLNDHMLIHTIPKELFFDSPEDIAKWREDRRRNYPTKETVERKLAEKQDRIRRGEVLPTRVSKYKGHGYQNGNPKSHFNFRRGRGRGRGRGSFHRGSGRGVPRGRSWAKSVHHSTFASENEHSEEETTYDSWEEMEVQRKGESQLSTNENSLDKSSEVSTSKTDLQLSEDSSELLCDVIGRQTSAVAAETTAELVDMMAEHTDTTTKHVDTTPEQIDKTSEHVDTTAGDSTFENVPSQPSINCASQVVAKSKHSSILPTTSRDDDLTDTIPRDTALQNAALNDTVMLHASSQDSNADQVGCGSQFPLRERTTGQRSKVEYQCLRRKKLTLLQKLLAPEMRSERNKILQCIKFIIDNNFFDSDCPSNDRQSV